MERDALERKKNSMKLWICNHYAESAKYSAPDVKFYYLFPADAHIERSLESEDPQRGRVGVFLHQGDKVMVGYASFFDHGGLDAFPDQDDWREHSKFQGAEIWKLLIRAGSHYHFNPETDPFCAGTGKIRPNRRPNEKTKTYTSQYALEA